MAEQKEHDVELVVGLRLPCGHEVYQALYSNDGVTGLDDVLDVAKASIPTTLRNRVERHRCELVSENNPYGQIREH